MADIYKLAQVMGASVKKTAQLIQSRLVITDTQLVARSQQGDNEAFTELVRRYQDFVVRLATGYLGEMEQGKDAAQETFIKAYQGLPYLEKQVQFNAWLYRICRNHCLNLLRRRKLENGREAASEGSTTPDLIGKMRLRKLISNLEDDYRDVIVLRYYQDMPYQQIAEILGLPISTVKIRLYRAKKMLKESLKGISYEMR